MSEATLITQSIINSTRPVKGIYPTAYICPVLGASVVFDSVDKNLITSLIPAQLYFSVISSEKFALDAGSTEVVSEIKVNGFKHRFTAILAITDADLDKLDAVIVICRKKTGEWVVYGAQNGLWKTAQDRMANANSGLVTVTFESQADQEEDYSEYEFIALADAEVTDVFTVIPIAEFLTSTRVVLGGMNSYYIHSTEYFSVHSATDGWVRTKSYVCADDNIILYFNTIADWTTDKPA